MGDSRKKDAEYEDTLGELLLIVPPPKETPALCPHIFVNIGNKIMTKNNLFFI
jgi:hypothetical protein